MRFALALSMGIVGLTFACSDDHDGHGGHMAAPPATACAADTRKDTYAPGLTKTAGTLTVRLAESRPGPPEKGTNAMTFEVLDGSGQPVEGASLVVTPWMPDHAHGSAAKPLVSPLGGGRYSVENIVLSMPGLWQVKVAVQAPRGAASVEAVFQFCLDG